MQKLLRRTKFLRPSTHSDSELRALASEADFIISLVRPIDFDVIDCSKRVKLIQRAGRRTSDIDLDAAAAHGIAVAAIPMASQARVAEHAMALMLALARRIVEGHSAVHAGRLDQTFAMVRGGSDWHQSGMDTTCCHTPSSTISLASMSIDSTS